MIPEIEFVEHVIDKTDMSDGVKEFIKTALRTSGEIPAITSSAQY